MPSAHLTILMCTSNHNISHFNSINTVSHARNMVFFTGTNTTWNNFVHEQAVIWEQTVLAWIINNHNHPVLIVKYEDVKKNTQTELRRMLNFLQVPYSSSRLKEVVARGYRMYRREHSQSFDHYTPDQRDTVRSTIERVSKYLKANGLLDKANVTLYL